MDSATPWSTKEAQLQRRTARSLTGAHVQDFYTAPATEWLPMSKLEAETRRNRIRAFMQPRRPPALASAPKRRRQVESDC